MSPLGRDRTLLVFWAFLAIAPLSQATTQECSSNARIPAGTDQVLREVEQSLRAYYWGWTRYDPKYFSPALYVSDRSGSCHVDGGDQCYPEPWGGCSSGSGGRCKTQVEKERFALELRGLARDHPDSPFAVTQAVFAAIRLGFFGVAEDILTVCSPMKVWWCDLATGHYLHRTGRSGESQVFFYKALGTMPEDFRCLLEDISPLLSDADRVWHNGLSPEERADFHTFFWWLTDPLYSEDGNDRWAEHIVRRLERVLHKSGLIAMGRSPDWDILTRGDGGFVRRGAWDSFQGITRTPVVSGGYHHYTSKKAAINHFVPDVFSLSGLDRGLKYRLEAEFEDEGYTRSSGPVTQLPSQVARFREGDSLLVAMASDLGAVGVLGETEEPGTGSGVDFVPGGNESLSGRVRFLTSQGPDQVAFFEPAPVSDRVALAGRIPNRMQIIGVEAFLPGASARDRRVLVPLEAGERLLSDLLLFRSKSSEPPHNRIQAVALMHGSNQVPRDQELGVYWEGYGIPAADSVGISVRLKGEEGGWLSGLGRAVGVVGEVHEGTLTWREPSGGGDPFTRAITLNLSGLGDGEYELVLEMELEGGEVLTRSRTFRVVEGGGG